MDNCTGQPAAAEQGSSAQDTRTPLGGSDSPSPPIINADSDKLLVQES